MGTTSTLSSTPRASPRCPVSPGPASIAPGTSSARRSRGSSSSDAATTRSSWEAAASSSARSTLSWAPCPAYWRRDQPCARAAPGTACSSATWWATSIRPVSAPTWPSDSPLGSCRSLFPLTSSPGGPQARSIATVCPGHRPNPTQPRPAASKPPDWDRRPPSGSPSVGPRSSARSGSAPTVTSLPSAARRWPPPS